MPAPWPNLRLDGDPRLVVGFRKGSGLITCYQVQIHQDTFDVFRGIAKAALDRVPKLTRRNYDYFGALEEDEYFALANTAIPSRPVGRHQGQSPRLGPPGSAEVAAALQMVAGTDQHQALSAGRVRRGLRLNLYMISFRTSAGFLGFIRKAGPQSLIKPGLRYFQYGDTLKRISRPDFVFDDRMDMIVGPDEVAIFSSAVVQVLFRDVGLVMGGVEGNVQQLADRFHQHLPLHAEGEEALRRYGNHGPRNAKRIHDLVHHRLDDLKVDPAAITQDFSTHELGSLLRNGELALTDESIPGYLDYLEGRLYHDDHTQEPRRADRFSRR